MRVLGRVLKGRRREGDERSPRPCPRRTVCLPWPRAESALSGSAHLPSRTEDSSEHRRDARLRLEQTFALFCPSPGAVQAHGPAAAHAPGWGRVLGSPASPRLPEHTPASHCHLPAQASGFLFSTSPRDLGRHLPCRECAGILFCLPRPGLSLNGDASHSASKDQNSKAQLQTGERPVPSRRVCPGLQWLLCPGKQAGSAPATSYDSWPEPGRLKPAIVRTVCFFELVGVLGPSLRIQCAAGFGLSGGGGKWRRQQHLPEPQPLLRDVAARA